MTQLIAPDTLRQYTRAALAVYDALHRAGAYTAEVQQALDQARRLIELASLAYLPDERQIFASSGKGAPRADMLDAYTRAQQALVDLKDGLYRLLQSRLTASDYPGASQVGEALAAIDPAYRDLAKLRERIDLFLPLAALLNEGRYSQVVKMLNDQWKSQRDPIAVLQISMKFPYTRDQVYCFDKDMQALLLEEIHCREAHARQMDDLILTLARGVTMAFRPVPASEYPYIPSQGEPMLWYWYWVDAFWMGTCPVTVAQFAAFARGQEAGYTEALRNVIGRENHPVTGITPQYALAFCNWASQVTGRKVRLPNDLEWKKAAGGADGRTYPWGEHPPSVQHCNFNKQIGGTTAVGSYSPRGDSPYGCVDMAGNVAEWVGSGVLCGGSFDSGNVNCGYRDQRSHYLYNDCGFRVCVSSI